MPYSNTHRSPKAEYSLFGDAEDRANMYRERLVMTLQRMLRSGMFSAKGLGAAGVGPPANAQNESGKHEVRFYSNTTYCHMWWCMLLFWILTLLVAGSCLLSRRCLAPQDQEYSWGTSRRYLLTAVYLVYMPMTE